VIGAAKIGGLGLDGDRRGGGEGEHSRFGRAGSESVILSVSRGHPPARYWYHGRSSAEQLSSIPSAGFTRAIRLYCRIYHITEHY
jgi:hypothetical protein